MSSRLFNLGLAGALALAASCGSPQKQSIPAVGSFAIPDNYSDELGQRLIVCSFQNEIDPATGLREVAPDLSTFLQAELGRINRFKVYCLFNDGTYRLAQDIAAHGADALVLPAPDPKTIDGLISVTVTATRSHSELRSGNVAHAYQVLAAAEIQDAASKEQLFGRNILGAKVVKETILGVNGERIGGHDPNDRNHVLRALDTSARVMLYDLVTELGYYYPANAQVTGMLGERVGLGSGEKDGFSNVGDVVVWDRNPAGVDVPLFLGQVQYGAQRTSVAIKGRNTREPAANQLIAQIESDPDWVSKNPGRLYATSRGLRAPEEWESAKAIADEVAKNRR